jgi:hypothetical protein
MSEKPLEVDAEVAAIEHALGLKRAVAVHA